MRFNRLSAFTLGVIITAASVGAITYVNAAGTQIIYSCANKITGVIRYVPKKKCVANERSLSWNVSGRTGTEGPQGLQGARGLKGDDGATGAKGEAGTRGTKGDEGATGSKGEAGINGTAGANGTNGAAGTNGNNGTNGTNGTNGQGVLADISMSLASTPIDTAIYGGFDWDAISTTNLYSNSQGVALDLACFYSTASSRSEFMVPYFFVRVKSPTNTVASVMRGQDDGAAQTQSWIGDGTFKRATPVAGQYVQTWRFDIYGSTINPVQVSFTISPTTSSCTVKAMYATK